MHRKLTSRQLDGVNNFSIREESFPILYFDSSSTTAASKMIHTNLIAINLSIKGFVSESNDLFKRRRKILLFE